MTPNLTPNPTLPGAQPHLEPSLSWSSTGTQPSLLEPSLPGTQPYLDPCPQVKALKRWDRIAAIRSIASRQANDQHDSQQRFARAGDSRGRAAAGRADLQELTHLLTYSLTHLLTYLLTYFYLLTYALTRSLTHAHYARTY